MNRIYKFIIILFTLYGENKRERERVFAAVMIESAVYKIDEISVVLRIDCLGKIL